MIRTIRALTLGSAAVVTAVVTATAGAVPAVAAAPPGSFEIDYDAAGSTHIAKPNSTVALGPTVSQTYISDSGNGTVSGTLPLPETSASFKIIGFLPVSAKVDFVQVGQIAGQLSAQPPLTLSATVKYTIRLSDVTVGGLPAFVGKTCQTASPVSISVATPAGQRFDISNGGTLAGTYTIGKFAHCGLTTGLVNLLIPGSGNTVSFQLSNGQFVE